MRSQRKAPVTRLVAYYWRQYWWPYYGDFGGGTDGDASGGTGGNTPAAGQAEKAKRPPARRKARVAKKVEMASAKAAVDKNNSDVADDTQNT